MDSTPTSTRSRGIRAHFPALAAARVLVFLLLTTAAISRAHAQELEGDLVYKFTVDGVAHRPEAKPIQYAMMDHRFVHACDFIEECGCFKLASGRALDHTALNDLLGETRHRLSGSVEVSDGTFLVPQQPQAR